MSAAVYGEDLSSYEMDWDTVRYTLDSSTGTSGDDGSDRYRSTAPAAALTTAATGTRPAAATTH